MLYEDIKCKYKFERECSELQTKNKNLYAIPTQPMKGDCELWVCVGVCM